MPAAQGTGRLRNWLLTNALWGIMRSGRFFVCSVVYCFVVLWFLPALAAGQTGNVRPLITQPVNEAQLNALRGNVHPLARAEFDQGAAPVDLPMERMLLVLKRSPDQERALIGLLDQQQDRNSPSYHRWLTPEEFGAAFGPADSDIQAVEGWLQNRGFQVTQVSKGRTVIEFSGTAAQVQQEFHTSIHKYVVKGEAHWANASDPQIPAALAPAVAGVASLHNFFKRPMNHFSGVFSKSLSTGQVTAINPEFTFPYQFCSGVDDCFAVGPYDFATIYNLLPLWNAGTNGSGQTIAIVGRTNINLQDAHNFRALFGLPANDPTVFLNGPDPGIIGDEGEADIDVQWSGAVAPGAKINLVVSESTETTDGVDLSALYIVDNNLAGIMSESYGQCEFYLGAAINQFYASLWEQAAAQGITAFVSSGDNGSAGCDYTGAAENGLQVNGLASTPFNVAVGGTDFNDFSNPLTFWNATNDATTQASAKGYVPESTWNDTCSNTLFSQLGFAGNAEFNCNDSRLADFVWTVAGSGGKSSCINGPPVLTSCSTGYPKPSWQTGNGVPNDGSRDLPDVSLFASNGFVGSFYIVCQKDAIPSASCDLNPPYLDFAGYGGTSVASPAFAGIMALVDQKMGARQGNANYVLYKLAAQASASCASKANPASSCTFYDITSGTIGPPCATGTPNCTTTFAGDTYGLLSGYTAAAGFDLATGLGSVNAANLVNNWKTVTFTPSATTLTLNSGNAVNITHGASVNFTASVTPQSGTGATPTGDVALLTSNGLSLGSFTLTGGSVSSSTTSLPGGTYTVSAHYGGSATYGGSDSAPPVSVTVGTENSKLAVRFESWDWNGNQISSNASSVTYGSPYLARVDVTNSAGASCAANPVSCPTGSVTLTENGTAMGGGTLALNNLGYSEDQTLSLAGGPHTLQAQYGGDNSYNASSASETVTVTPAPTTSTLSGPGNVTVGPLPQLLLDVQAQSFGVPPGGTVTFLLDGSPLSGTLIRGAPFVRGTVVNTYFYFQTSISSPGLKTITANYSGDSNYAPSSGTLSISAQYPTTTTLSANFLNPAPGQRVTLTAVVNTSAKSPALSGTVTYSGSPQAVNGTPTLSAVTDASGNAALQATLSFTPSVNTESVGVVYSGDTNYLGSSSNYVTVQVAGNDFSLEIDEPGLSIQAPGASGIIGLNVDGQSGYTGTATFACKGLPPESTCDFSPASVQGSGGTFLTIQTTAAHTVALIEAPAHHGYRWLGGASGMAFVAILLIGGGPRKRRVRFLAGFIAVILVLPMVCCGGGGGGGGGGGHTDPGTPVGNYSVTVTATSGSLSHSATFPLSVH